MLDESSFELSPEQLRPAWFDLTGQLARLIAPGGVIRFMPDTLALLLARARGRVRWYWPPARRRAIGRLLLTLAGTGRESEVAALAREELLIESLRQEMTMRRWLTERLPIEGREILERALDSGRPLIIVGMHLGVGAVNVLAAAGCRVVVVVGEWLAPQPDRRLRGFAGHRVRARRQYFDRHGVRLLRAGGAYPTVRELLEQRVPCLLMLDLPGSTATSMAGKTGYLRSGLPRLAVETGALVLPFEALLTQESVHFRIHEPLDARSAGDPQGILDRLGALFGEIVVRHPASIEPLGLMREIWRDDCPDLSMELWRRPGLRQRLRWKAHGARRRLRKGLTRRPLG